MFVKLALIGLAGIVTSASQAQQVESLVNTNGSPTDQLIVKYKDGTRSTTPLDAGDVDAIRALTLLEGFGSRYVRRTATGGHVVKLDRTASLEAIRRIAIRIAASDASVEYAEPDLIAFPAQSAPNDTYYLQQWPLFDPLGGINAPSAWTYSTGAGVFVAVIDTGHRPHPELLANGYNGYDFVSGPSNDGNGRDSNAEDPGDWRTANQCPAPINNANSSSWHGTHVAGIIAAQWNNGNGIAGVAPNAKLVSVRVLGSCGGYQSDIADGMTWGSGGAVPGAPANTTPAKVLNVSIGGSGGCPSNIQSAITGARSRGAVVVVGAGNSNANVSGTWPANCYGVITVTATDRSGARWFADANIGSNTGSAVALAAPGEFVWSTMNTGTTTPGFDSIEARSGTSMATPHVAAVAALMRSVNTTLLPDDVGIILKGTTRSFPVACSGCGTGILNAAAAVNAVRPSAPKGTFTTNYATRSGTTAFAAITNTGPGWLTGITASCSQPGSAITVAPPSALGPGQSMTVQASVNTNTYTCGFVIGANNATSSPHTISNF